MSGVIQERTVGKRKADLLNKVYNEVKYLGDKGVDGFAYVRKRYNVTLENFSKKLTTKELTGVISDLKELRSTL